MYGLMQSSRRVANRDGVGSLGRYDYRSKYDDLDKEEIRYEEGE